MENKSQPRLRVKYKKILDCSFLNLQSPSISQKQQPRVKPAASVLSSQAVRSYTTQRMPTSDKSGSFALSGTLQQLRYLCIGLNEKQQ